MERRSAAPSARAERAGDRPAAPAPAGPHADGSAGALLPPLLTAAAEKATARWMRSRRPGLTRVLRGAVAGAGAAGIVYALRRVTDDPPGLELTDELLAGAGRGVVYASLLEPVLPGPTLMRGALVGTLDFLLVPWGGLFSRLQGLSPARKIPVVNALLEVGDAEDDPYLSFLVYGVALAILHGDSGAGG